MDTLLKIVLLVGIIVVVLLSLILCILFTPVCDGGELLQNDCGKILFPWVKKFKLPSGKYCCQKCYLRDLQSFVEIRKDTETGSVDEKELSAQKELEKSADK